ncbi:AraC family transcriptional regulator [Jeotgalicoccus marinus]|uniref:AraC family transcriptional regulator n=1 Tax=Jeotgalicoccus marinus TaxID=516700 RepID=UPI0003FF7A16|nr:AraC family transcriptional regulator [Jeotgalicoccus marinus]
MTLDITCEKRIYTNDVTSHFHEHGQLLFPLYGSMDLKTIEQQVKLTPDYVYYLAPKSKHTFHSTDQNEFLVLDIPNNMLPGETRDMYVEMNTQWVSVKQLLMNETANNAIANLTNYVVDKLDTTTPKSIDYIHKNYKDRVSIERLAAEENYHPSYYSKWFKKQTGKSVKAYLDELRLLEAKRLLQFSSWTITRIAGEIGYDNVSSFTRWFVKAQGMSPHAFKELKKR